MNQPRSRCWALDVSPCSGPITDEHYITYGLFDGPTAHIAAGPLATGGPRENMPVQRLVTKCLCEGHNNGMADLDQAAIDFQNVLRRMAELHEERTHLRATLGTVNFDPIALTVDGCRLERWLFKFAFSAAPVFRAKIARWRPSPHIAALAVGTRPITGPLGLYLVAQQGGPVTNEQRITFSYGRRTEGGSPVAFTAAIRGGYRLACAWEEPRTVGEPLLFDGSKRPPGQLIWHPIGFGFHINHRDAGLSIRFDWSGSWITEDHPDVVALRARYPAPPR